MTSTELIAMLTLLGMLLIMAMCITQVIVYQEKHFEELDEINRLRAEL